MKIVDPYDRTTLLLNRSYQPINFMTARAAFHHILTGRVHGIDSEGFEFTADDVDIANHFDDQPCLRSAHHVHIVPTIVVCVRFHRRVTRRDPNLSTRAVYKLYRGVCQYCLRKIPYAQATKDHVYPRSKGGTNHDFNLVLSCKKCNAQKGSIHPYFNVNGDEVKPRSADQLRFIAVDEDENIRDEWKQFLYMT